jgi:hypothetical protein
MSKSWRFTPVFGTVALFGEKFFATRGFIVLTA